MHEHSTSTSPSPRRTAFLLLFLGRQTCESSKGGRNYLQPGPSTGENKDRWDHKEAEAEGKDEEREGGSDQDNTYLMCSTNKRCLSTAGEKAPWKRNTKRCRFSSSLSSDEKTEKTGDKSDASSYALIKPHRIISFRPSLSHLTSLDEDTSDDSKMKIDGQSEWSQTFQTAII